MANAVLGKSLGSDWFSLSQDFAFCIETVQPMYFFFLSEAGKFKICNQNSKNKNWILSFFTVKLSQEAKKIEIFPTFSKMDEKDKHSPSEFYYPEDLETFDLETETGITECHTINKLLTELAWAILGNVGPRSWQYRLSKARSVLPLPRLVSARLVSS